MNPVCFFVIAILLQTTVATVKDPLEGLWLEAALSVPLFDVSFGSLGHEEPMWNLPRRELAASVSENCIWHKNVSACGMSSAAKIDILQSSTSGFAELWMHDLECQTNGTNEQSCDALDECGWRKATETCEFVDQLNRYSDSPCVANAPLTFNNSRLSRKCPSRTSATSCERLDGCVWNEQDERCFADYYRIMFGLESRMAFSRDYIKVVSVKITDGLTQAARRLNNLATKSDWDSILSFEIPKTNCPKRYEQVVCDYADAYVSNMFSEFIYCRYRYRNETRKTCNADPLCSHSKDQGCLHSAEIIHDALTEADKVLLDLIPDAPDRYLARQVLHCGRIANETECTENCRWSEDSCVLGRTYMYRQFLRKDEENTTDPICMSFQMQLDSGCLDLIRNKTCTDNENCGWREQTQECIVSEAMAKDLLFEEDPKLKKPYNRAESRCHSITQARECQRA